MPGKTVKIWTMSCFIVLLVANILIAQKLAGNEPSPFFNGITLENMNGSAEQNKPVLVLVKNINVPVVIRIVFQKDTIPKDYESALIELKKQKNVTIMGLFLDSKALKEYKLNEDLKRKFSTHPQNPQQYADYCNNESDKRNKSYPKRINCFLDYLDSYVDIWEVGNEVNGDWVDEGSKGNAKPEKTIEKIQYAIERVKAKNIEKKEQKALALTLVHMPECTKEGWEGNDMLTWSRANLDGKIPSKTFDYLLVSYYEDNCDQGTRTSLPSDVLEPIRDQERRNAYWNKLFIDLEGIFKDAGKLGFGEVGYSSDVKTCANDHLSYCTVCNRQEFGVGSKLALLERYYSLKIDNPKYIGGHFWWTAQDDMTNEVFFRALLAQFGNH